MANVKLVLGTMTFGESVFAPQVGELVNAFLDAGYDELDTAYVYNEGNCERLLGEALKNIGKPFKIATKVNPRISGRLDGQAVRKQVNESLERLGLPCVDVVYLHFPDPATPVEDALAACNELHSQGKFKELGLSNFPAWMVADAWRQCEKNHWVKPSIYEGIYDPLTRKAEIELNACLNNFGMRFYAYNPLAGGLLSGRYTSFEEQPGDGRFTHRPNYQARYWKKSFFEAMEVIRTAAAEHGLTLIEATYRWLVYHSMLQGDRRDAIILGVSKPAHLAQNLATVQAGPLPQPLIEAFAHAWTITKADSPEYFTLYKRNKNA